MSGSTTAPQEEPPAAWQACDSLLVDDWGGDHSVFCPATGETHLLSSLPSEALKELSQAPLTAGELAASLALACGVECSDDWLTKITAIINDLAALELIEKPSAADATRERG